MKGYKFSDHPALGSTHQLLYQTDSIKLKNAQNINKITRLVNIKSYTLLHIEFKKPKLSLNENLIMPRYRSITNKHFR